MRSVPWSALVAALLAAWSPALSPGQEAAPLRERIDTLIEAAAVGPLAPLCSDADFVRRVYLDLTGVIPTADEARAFLNDADPQKREKLVDRLLASPAFVRHMAITLDVMLQERRRDDKVKQEDWQEYLYSSVAVNKPLDQLFRELLTADGADQAQRAPARFVLSREAEPNLVTRDLGRLAFGMDLQCAQCHDHPLIDDYYQDDYYGLFAFVQRTTLFTEPKSKQVQLTENAEGEASFKSVFTGDGSDRALPRLPKGAVVFIEPTFPKGEEYLTKPDKAVRGVPKYSRRAKLAELLADSEPFRRNLANRIWALMLGRGIVHPVDFHHADNPPAHPELLALLAEELATSGFQLRPMIREIALTRAYGRSCDTPRPDVVNFADVAARLGQLQRERDELAAALAPLKESLAKARGDYKSALAANAKITAEQPKLEKALADARQAAEKATAEQKLAAEALAKAQEQAAVVAEAAGKVAEAANKIADDQVLADTAKKLGERASQLASAASAAQQASREKAAASEAKAKELAAAQAALDALLAGRVPPAELSELQQQEVGRTSNLRDAQYKLAAIEARIQTCQDLLAYRSLAAADAEKAETAWNSLIERWTIAGQIAQLKPLTPEQFAASAMQATDALDGQQQAAAKAIDSKPPESLAKAAEAEKDAIRTQLVELKLLDQLGRTFNEFVKHYGGLPGEDFQATVNQALFFGNGSVVDAWLKPAGDNLVARLAKMEDPDLLADEMYFAVFSRPATETEKSGVSDYLKDRTDKPVAVGEMAWGLLSSGEFRFNH